MLTEGNNVKNFLEMDIMNRQFILDGVLCWVMFYKFTFLIMVPLEDSGNNWFGSGRESLRCE